MLTACLASRRYWYWLWSGQQTLLHRCIYCDTFLLRDELNCARHEKPEDVKPSRARRAFLSLTNFSVRTYFCLKSTLPSLILKALMFPSPLNHCGTCQRRASAPLMHLCLAYGVVVHEWRELRIRHDAIERSIDLRGHLADDLEVVDLALKAVWPHEARELGGAGEGFARRRRGHGSKVASHLCFVRISPGSSKGDTNDDGRSY